MKLDDILVVLALAPFVGTMWLVFLGSLVLAGRWLYDCVSTRRAERNWRRT